MATASSSPCCPIGPGRVVLVVGPSGAGKDTLIAIAGAKLKSDIDTQRRDIRFPKRFVTRPSSLAEDNFSLSSAEFDQALACHQFALQWRAHDTSYGISADIDGAIQVGACVVINVSRGVIAAARRRFASVTVVYVDAPVDLRVQRITQRGRETVADQASRLPQATDAFLASEADLVIMNDREADAAGLLLYDFLIAITS